MRPDDDLVMTLHFVWTVRQQEPEDHRSARTQLVDDSVAVARDGERSEAVSARGVSEISETCALRCRLGQCCVSGIDRER